MKTFWILEPSPFKSTRSINAIIYANIVRAQGHFDRPLKRQEIHNLIKTMKEKGLFASKQDTWDLYNGFISTMKQHKKVQEKKPKATS